MNDDFTTRLTRGEWYGLAFLLLVMLLSAAWSWWRYMALLALVVLVGCSGPPTAPTPVTNVPVTSPAVVTPPTSNPLLADPRFDRSFYRQFALNGYELPLQRLSRWTRAPLVYLRTIDDAGAAIHAGLVDQTAAAIINSLGGFTGGVFGIAGLERGTETREGQRGWLTIKWRTTGTCGTTFGVGVEGGSIELNHRRPECTCGPLVIKHELGHAMGYWHTDRPTDLMVATFQGVCDKNLSDRELFHARVAYSQPLGSLEP